MTKSGSQRIELIPTESVNVINPRVRSKKSFRELVESISAVGLKRPITVTRSPNADTSLPYDLVCGQGRLEAFKVLNESVIPAFIIVADIREAMVKSLVENCARRQHSATDLLRDINRLKSLQYSNAEIGRKTGLSKEYVRGITLLMAQGEQRLLRAVDAGQIPLSVAVDIASTDDTEVQDALQKAYERNELRGHKLLLARRLIENRKHRGKRLGGPVTSRTERVSSASLMRAYQEDTDRKRLFVRKADAVRNRLLFITHAVKQMLSDDTFHEILESEGLSTLPKNLATRISRGEIA
jgi:ParB family chromosome partitioning protein